jgi:hypothetical protein
MAFLTWLLSNFSETCGVWACIVFCELFKTMPLTNPAYPPKFRREVIRLVSASDEVHPILRIARQLGLSDGTLQKA